MNNYQLQQVFSSARHALWHALAVKVKQKRTLFIELSRINSGGFNYDVVRERVAEKREGFREMTAVVIT